MKQLHFKNFIAIVLIAIIVVMGAYNCQPVKTNEKPSSDSLVFDSTLAAQLGADERGMRKYFLAFLKRGPKRDQDSATAAEIQRGHMANITKMAEDGKLVLAGPFMDDQEFRGIYVFAVETMEEAVALTENDPAVKSGRLVMELHPWYGSAALMQINEIHSKISK